MVSIKKKKQHHTKKHLLGDFLENLCSLCPEFLTADLPCFGFNV